MTVVPFQAEHLSQLRTQPAQVTEIALVTIENVQALEASDAWTIFDGEPLFCGGVIEVCGIGMLWAFVSGEAGSRMKTITRMCARYLDLKRLRRIETIVKADFGAGCRWAKILGFECEGLMRKYAPDGSDYFRYARVL